MKYQKITSLVYWVKDEDLIETKDGAKHPLSLSDSI